MWAAARQSGHLGGDRGVMGPLHFDERVRQNLPGARRVQERSVREPAARPQRSGSPREESEKIACAFRGIRRGVPEPGPLWRRADPGLRGGRFREAAVFARDGVRIPLRR